MASRRITGHSHTSSAKIRSGSALSQRAAKAAEASVQADLASNAQETADLGLTVTQLPNFAANTDAAMLQGEKSAGALSVAGRAMMVLRNATFFAFSDVAVGGGKPPSEQAMKDKANEILATLPH